jgi:hypothetical protein
LKPDGTVWIGDAEIGSWKLAGTTLTLTWPNENAPGGAWVDTVLVTPEGSRYEGTNQRNVPIFGVRP